MSLFLHIRAPFGAFRWLQAGVYRATSPTIPPSAAWGLVLNIAGIESRDSASRTVTLRREDVPRFQVAIGEVREPEPSSLYQQLHGYPVGGSGKDLAARSQGSKYWIAPARRELLAGVDLVIGIRDFQDDLRSALRRGLSGENLRYGLPFLGDNNFLIDHIELLEQPISARWYSRIGERGVGRSGTCRLTVDIDREDSARTRTAIFERGRQELPEPPDQAWTAVPG